MKYADVNALLCELGQDVIIKDPTTGQERADIVIRTQTIPKDQRTDGIWRGHFGGKCYGWNDPECAKLRSQTPKGVARAMAEQWVDYIENGDEQYKIEI